MATWDSPRCNSGCDAGSASPIRPSRVGVPVLDPQTVAAIAHPVRVAILGEITRRDMATTTELAAALEVRPGTVSYHVGRLEALGLLRLVRRVRRRGATAYYYALRESDDGQDVEGDLVRAWLEPGRSTRPDFSVVLDKVAMAELREPVEHLYASMRELEAATISRTGVERAGPAFRVHVGFDVQRLPRATRATGGTR